jgi:heptaprenyl diphosphate synthase
MGQILLNIDSPVSSIRYGRANPVQTTAALNSLETLRKAVLPYMQTIVGEKTSAIQDNHLDAYIARVMSKLERAWFTKLAAEAIDPSADVPISLLSAVELRYLYDQILDDIADCSVERCAGPTLHLQVGIPKAVYLAEILMAISTECLGCSLEESSISRSLSIEAFKAWGGRNTQVNIAQYQDLVYEHVSLDQITPSTVLDLIDGTTGQDLANCFFLGGLIVESDPDNLCRLHKIGQCVGILIQMRDDLIDYINDSSIINKEPLLDFKHGHKKLPLVTAYHHSTILEKQEILALMQQSDYSPEDITRIQKLILNPSALAYQASLSNEFIRQIDENLDALGASEAATTLRTFVHTYLKLDI